MNRSIFLFVLILLSAHSKYIIQTKTRIIKWDGCIYQHFNVLRSNIDSCINCAKNKSDESSDVKFRPEDKQLYRNCSVDCKRPTLCTVTNYHIESQWISECYQCSEYPHETIKYSMIRLYEICSDECKECALQADLVTATGCAAKCSGYPTFCHPPEMWLGHRLCYRSKRLYGCRYFKVNENYLSEGCLKCASMPKATMEYSQECAPECGGMSTFHYVDTNLIRARDYVYFQCKLIPYGAIHIYHYPAFIIKFLKIPREDFDIASTNQLQFESASTGHPMIDENFEMFIDPTD